MVIKKRLLSLKAKFKHNNPLIYDQIKHSSYMMDTPYKEIQKVKISRKKSKSTKKTAPATERATERI